MWQRRRVVSILTKRTVQGGGGSQARLLVGFSARAWGQARRRWQGVRCEGGCASTGAQLQSIERSPPSCRATRDMTPAEIALQIALPASTPDIGSKWA